jgi:AbrB family looped-hinge helix DNA binding protein
MSPHVHPDGAPDAADAAWDFPTYSPTTFMLWERKWEPMTTTVDERGRILIPREFREAHGLTPGRAVIIEDTPEGVTLRAALPKADALARLAGAIKTPRAKDAPDPLHAKRIWERSP